MSIAKRKCKQCKEYTAHYIKINAGVFCDIDHAIVWANNKTTKAQEKAIKDKIKDDKKQHKADKDRIKTKAKLLSELQHVFNQYVRLRDEKEGCISCNKHNNWHGQWHASHYYSRGHSSFLRFNLWNVHKSCSVCNFHLSGNIGEYTPKLIDKIGQERFNYLLTHKSKVRSFDIAWIKRAIKTTKKGIKLKKRSCTL